MILLLFVAAAGLFSWLVIGLVVWRAARTGVRKLMGVVDADNYESPAAEERHPLNYSSGYRPPPGA